MKMVALAVIAVLGAAPAIAKAQVQPQIDSASAVSAAADPQVVNSPAVAPTAPPQSPYMAAGMPGRAETGGETTKQTLAERASWAVILVGVALVWVVARRRKLGRVTA